VPEISIEQLEDGRTVGGSDVQPPGRHRVYLPSLGQGWAMPGRALTPSAGRQESVPLE
jgi:hypothetical protein